MTELYILLTGIGIGSYDNNINSLFAPLKIFS